MSRDLRLRVWHLAAALAVVAADRVSKGLVQEHIAPYRSIPIVPGLFDLTYVENPGGVFGIFKGLDEGLRAILFTAVPAVAIALIAIYSRSVPAAHRLTQYSLALILGGAIGNLSDRLWLGYVVDFLDFYWRSHHWPAFNVADSAICVGVGLLMLEAALAPRPDPEAQVPPPAVEPSGRDTP